MPRKKAEPEVLQEETVQPEITDIEELTPAEQPALETQIEEPVQPYGEGESSAAEELPEPSEPEKKSFYNLDVRALDQDLSPEQRQEWNTIYASFRSRSVMRGTIIGVDPHSMTVRSAQTGLVECYGYDVNLSQRDMSYAAIPDLREQYHPGDELTCVVKQFDRKAGTLEISVKETVPNPFDEASLRHPIGCRRRAIIAGKYAGGVFCNLPDGAVVMCRYSFHYEDSDFKTGDTVMVVIQRYDEGKKQIFGKIVGR